MCTLTYLPRPEGYLLTHSRDESPHRPSSDRIYKKQVENLELYYPLDLEARGTWIGMSSFLSDNRTKGRSACVLNGGSIPYQRQAPYARSRGELVLAVLQARHATEWVANFDFSAFEPFTLIVKEEDAIYQMVHNPEQDELFKLNGDEPHIWSSTTLYKPPVRAERASHFYHWLASKPLINPETLREFHLRGYEAQQFPGFKLYIPGQVETVSLTQIAVSGTARKMHYHHLLKDQEDHVLLES